MIRTVAFINTTAYRAGTRRVAWVHRNKSHACERSLVLDKLAELIKRPVCVLCPLPVPNRYPVSDTLEVFKSNPTPSVLRGLHNTLADAVVGVSLIAMLLARHLAKLALGCLRPLALKIATAVFVLAALVVDCPATILLAIAVGGKIDDAKINAKELSNVIRLWRFDLASNKQVELAVDIAKVGLAPVAI